MYVLLVAVLVTGQALSTPACKDPERAEALCEKAYELFDAGTITERRLEICRTENAGLERKLEIRTSSVVIQERTVEVFPDWGWVALSVLAAIAGTSAGIALTR